MPGTSSAKPRFCPGMTNFAGELYFIGCILSQTLGIGSFLRRGQVARHPQKVGFAGRSEAG